MKRIILFVISIRFNLCAIYKFCKLNFFTRRIIRDKGTYIFPYPKTYIQLSKESKIILHGDLKLNMPEMAYTYKYGYLAMRGNSQLTINKSCELLEGFDVQIHDGGHLLIDAFHANIDLEISCGNQTELRGTVVAGRHVRIKDFNGHQVSYEGYPVSAPILIDNHTWLCTGVSINPGVHVGSGAVVSDNSCVVNDVEPNTFVQGNPAKVVRSNIEFCI